ncbi:MAG: FAD-binding oxidoreductase [Planctomycetes bacterium]|nr:FAD-binding oxidoreductase [Planctomycetota bacterium]
MERKDIVIVGAGIIGVSAAFYLSKENARVVLVDRSFIGREASGATAGTMSFQNKLPRLVPYVRHSIDLWTQLQNELGDTIEFRQPGGLRIAESEEQKAALHRSIESQKKVGLDVEFLEGGDLRNFAPFLGPSVIAATYYEGDARSNPITAPLALALAAKERGVKIIENDAVTAIEVKSNNRFLVRTKEHLLEASSVINAAGVWSNEIFKMVGHDFPVTLDPMQVMVTERSTRIFDYIITHVNGNLTLKQVDSGNVVIGGGRKGEGDEKKGIKKPLYESMKGSIQSACRAVPALQSLNLIRCWVGLEGRTPDNIPLLGALDSCPGFLSASCAKGGWTLGPLLGKLVSEMALEKESSLPVEEFHPRRFLSS